MNVFDGTVSIYDIALAPLELAGLSRLRRRLISEAHGVVLQIGTGTGLDFPHYVQGARVLWERAILGSFHLDLFASLAGSSDAARHWKHRS